ncbi:hypothetical protein ACK3TF_006049 [Chlorella vulgaris]
MLKEVKTVVGTSAGSLLGALVATRRDLRASLETLCSHGYYPDFDFARLFTEYGLDSGRSIDSLTGALLPADVTFRQVLEDFDTRLVVVATNLSSRKSEYFGPDTHPDMQVALAIRMSCSIPLYFKAVHYQGSWYVDGSVTNNLACQWAQRNGCSRVLGVSLKPRATTIKTLESFLGSIVEAATSAQEPGSAHVLELDASGVSSFNFGASRSTLLCLFSSGAHQASSFLKKNL